MTRIAKCLIVALVGFLSCPWAIAADLTEQDWQLVREQIDVIEAEADESDESHEWWWQRRTLQVLVAAGEIERAWAILDATEGGTRRGHLMCLARDCVHTGRGDVALQFFEAVEEPTWRDIDMLAEVARDDIDFAPFDACLPTPMTAEERWLALTIKWDATNWSDTYEQGKQIETFEHPESSTWMIRLWLNATQFSEYEDDELLWSTEPYETNRLAASVSRQLFRDDQCDRAFEILQLSNVNVRESELRLLIGNLKEMRTTTFPDRETLSTYLREHEQYFVNELLVAAAIGNHDWEAAVAHANTSLSDRRRQRLLNSILLASTEAGASVPELLEYETTLLGDGSAARDHAAFLQQELLAGVRDNVSRRLDTITELFKSDSFPRLAYPVLAEIADEADRQRILDLLLSVRESGYPSRERAIAFLILGEDEEYLRLMEYRSDDDESESCGGPFVRSALLQYVERFPSLDARLAVLDRLDLERCDGPNRLEMLYEYLESHGMHAFDSDWLSF